MLCVCACVCVYVRVCVRVCVLSYCAERCSHCIAWSAVSDTLLSNTSTGHEEQTGACAFTIEKNEICIFMYILIKPIYYKIA